MSDLSDPLDVWDLLADIRFRNNRAAKVIADLDAGGSNKQPLGALLADARRLVLAVNAAAFLHQPHSAGFGATCCDIDADDMPCGTLRRITGALASSP